MTRFVLRFRGQGECPPADIARVRALPETSVLDESSSRMLLVESRENALRELMTTLPGWVWSLEHIVSVPDPRPKPGRGPGPRAVSSHQRVNRRGSRRG